MSLFINYLWFRERDLFINYLGLVGRANYTTDPDLYQGSRFVRGTQIYIKDIDCYKGLRFIQGFYVFEL
jgi:hypothetical protein